MASVSHGQYPQKRPNGLWRGASAMTMGLTTTTSKVFLYGLNRVEVTGLDKFVELLESRRDPFERERGLITGKQQEGILMLFFSFAYNILSQSATTCRCKCQRQTKHQEPL